MASARSTVVISGRRDKLRRIRMSLERKIEILRRLDAKERVVDIARKYGINESTVRTVRKCRDKIVRDLHLAGGQDGGKRLHVKNQVLLKTENVLYKYVCAQRELNMYVDSNAIRRKAREIYGKVAQRMRVTNPTPFTASSGWFSNFCGRMELRPVRTCGDAAVFVYLPVMDTSDDSHESAKPESRKEAERAQENEEKRMSKELRSGRVDKQDSLINGDDFKIEPEYYEEDVELPAREFVEEKDADFLGFEDNPTPSLIGKRGQDDDNKNEGDNEITVQDGVDWSNLDEHNSRYSDSDDNSETNLTYVDDSDLDEDYVPEDCDSTDSEESNRFGKYKGQLTSKNNNFVKDLSNWEVTQSLKNVRKVDGKNEAYNRVRPLSDKCPESDLKVTKAKETYTGNSVKPGARKRLRQKVWVSTSMLQPGSLNVGLEGMTKQIRKTSDRVRETGSQTAVIESEPPSPTCGAKGLTDPEECLKLFINNHVVNKILLHTNEILGEGKNMYGEPSANYLDVDVNELYAFIGLLIMSGCMSGHTTEELWHALYGCNIFRVTMSMQRFQILMKFLSFDDAGSRTEREMDDALAPIREIWDIFVSSWKENFIPGRNIVIDEQILEVSGECKFKLYIPGNPAKYAIKSVVACDVETKYVFNAVPYLGRDTKLRGFPYAEYLVKELCKPIYGSWRNVTLGKRFTSVPLAKQLLKDYYKLTVLGLLCHDPESTCGIADSNSDLNLVTLTTRLDKNLSLLSTMHKGSHGEAHRKSEIISSYKNTRVGVDAFTQTCSQYKCSMQTEQWPLRLFLGLVHASVINAWIIQCCNLKDQKKNTVELPIFMKQLALKLTKPWIQTHLKEGKNLQQDISEVSLKQKSDTNETVFRAKHKACHMCPGFLDRESALTCSHCQRPVCNEHFKPVCVRCTGRFEC